MDTKSKRKKRNSFGVIPGTHPRSVRWAVDFDYVHKLTAEEKEFLAEFTDSYYGADFRSQPEGWDREERRKAYGRKNSANRDGFTKWNRVSLGKGREHVSPDTEPAEPVEKERTEHDDGQGQES